jgi:membrane-anchored protein YejM (alkaline phosphatase superfamily)
MRRFIARLIYQKWFFAFLAAVLWLHVWTDAEDVIDINSARESIALVLSLVAAFMATMVFLDLHLRRPRKDS